VAEVVVSCRRNLKLAWKELRSMASKKTTPLAHLRELARGYVEGSLSPIEHSKVFGYLYGEPTEFGDMIRSLVTTMQKEKAASTPAPSLAPPLPNPHDAPATPQMPLSRAIDAYRASLLSEGAKATVKALEAMSFDLQEYFGASTDVHSITHKDMLAFRDCLSRLPPNRSKGKLAGIPIRDLASMVHDKTLSATTMKNKATLLTMVFRWLYKHEYVKNNPAHDLLPNSRRVAKQVIPREAFTSDDISLIFEKLVNRQRSKRVDRYWYTMIAAYTGMRIGEIAQLQRDNLKQDGGIWYLDIEAVVEVKNEPSRRQIPVHPRLEEIGLVQYVQGKTGGIFTSNTKNAVGKWFNRCVQELLPNRKVMYHCWRHTVSTHLQRASVPREQIAALLGHTQEGETFRTYGKGFTLAQLSQAIAKLAY